MTSRRPRAAHRPAPSRAAGRWGVGAAVVVALLLPAPPAAATPLGPPVPSSVVGASAGPLPGPPPGAAGAAPSRAAPSRAAGARAVPTGRWSWPLAPEPRVVRGFDPPARRWLAGHRGVDLAATPGSAVVSPVDGEVVWARRVVDRGVVVVLGPGGRRATLEPVDASVAVGDRVARGQRLGTLAAGHCPGGCLHWGVREGTGPRAAYLDPLALLGPAAPPVLLPLPRGPRLS